MVKLSMVGALDSWHGRCLSAIFNGCADNIAENSPWRVGMDMPRIEGATITKVYDPSKALAREFLTVRKIEGIADSLDDAMKDVDGVIVPDDCTLTNHYRGRFFVERGIPCFVDKPLAARVTEARAMVNLAEEKGTLMLSASAIRFSDEITDVIVNAREKIGAVRRAFAIAPFPDPVFYGIHAVEPVIAVMGTGVRAVQSVGTIDEPLYVLRWDDGKTATISCSSDNPGIQAIFYGEKGYVDAPARKNTFYLRLMEQLVKMIKTRELPVPYAETMEVLKIGEAAVSSARAGGAEVILENVK